jgi:hypothetical protein
MKKTAGIVAVGIAGFLLGTMAGHQTTVKAQPGTKVTYKEILSQYSTTEIPSSQIVGFSCVPHEGL